jgi:hypothetical protein
MPDRYGDETPAVADFDSRRRAREAKEAAECARQQRQRLTETRTTHAPLTRDQSEAGRRHQRAVTDRADAHRNKIRIANCGLCDDDGYRGATVCDHIDHSAAARRGMAKIRAALAKDTDQ